MVFLYESIPRFFGVASGVADDIISVFATQKIMGDPVMQSILQQAQSDPKALQDHMKNPAVRDNIMKLVNAGVIRTR